MNSATSTSPHTQRDARARPPPLASFAGIREVAMIVREAGVRWVDDACYRMGASLAYYALFSIFPLLLVAITVLGYFLGNDPATRERIVASTSSVLSPEFR